MPGYMVRSNSHVDYAWLNTREPYRNRWMYSHRHGTVFLTHAEAEKAMRRAYRLHLESGDSKTMNLELEVVSADSRESLYGTFSKLVPECR